MHEHSHWPRMQAVDHRPRNNPIHRPTNLVGLFGLLFVGLTVFVLCLPFVRFVFLRSDEGVLLHGAERLLRGHRLYIDFFEFLPPGGFVITAIWFGITGISIWSARLMAILTITGIACFTYLACRQACKHELSSALVAVGWVIMSQGAWTQINHHWLSTLFSMVAIWATLVSVEKSPRRQWGPLIAGGAAGSAAMVTPTQGVLTILAAASSFVESYNQRAKLIAYILGSALIPIGFLAYLIAQSALAAAFDDVILFTAKQYARVQSTPFGYLADNQNRPLTYLFPIVALLTLITCVRDWRASFHDPLFRSSAAFGLAGFISCFPRPDVFHIAFVTPLVCPLLTYCTKRIVASWLPKYRYALAAVVISLGIFPVFAFSFAAHTALRTKLFETPRGNVTFPQNGNQELMALISATPSSDAYFFYPYMPILPFLTAREHVSKYDVFLPGYTLPSQYQDACVSVMRHASWVVIDQVWTDPSFLRAIYPAIRNIEPRERRMFEQVLNGGFELVAREGAFELRRRREGISDTVCADIAE